MAPLRTTDADDECIAIVRGLGEARCCPLSSVGSDSHWCAPLGEFYEVQSGRHLMTLSRVSLELTASTALASLSLSAPNTESSRRVAELNCQRVVVPFIWSICADSSQAATYPVPRGRTDRTVDWRNFAITGSMRGLSVGSSARSLSRSMTTSSLRVVPTGLTPRLRLTGDSRCEISRKVI